MITSHSFIIELSLSQSERSSRMTKHAYVHTRSFDCTLISAGEGEIEFHSSEISLSRTFSSDVAPLSGEERVFHFSRFRSEIRSFRELSLVHAHLWCPLLGLHRNGRTKVWSLITRRRCHGFPGRLRHRDRDRLTQPRAD